MRQLIAVLSTLLALTWLGGAYAAEKVWPELAAAREAVLGEDSALLGDEDALSEAIIELIRAELHRVQIAVERWGVDNSPYPPAELGIYPLSVNQLVHPWAEYDDESYIEPGFYANPLSPGEEGQPNAMCVPFGWHDLSPGNFSYLTQINEYTGEATAYVIVGYGPTQASERDLDGDGLTEGAVIILVGGNPEWGESLTLYDSGRRLELRLAELRAEE